jgi:hypothetical protein
LQNGRRVGAQKKKEKGKVQFFFYWPFPRLTTRVYSIKNIEVDAEAQNKILEQLKVMTEGNNEITATTTRKKRNK